MVCHASGLILDGGRARRLGGVHKSFLPAPAEEGATEADQPSSIAERTVALLGRLTSETLVASRWPERWDGLPVRTVTDPVPDAGPLAGIAAGLAAAREPWLLVVAGDMPRLSEPVLRALLDRRCDDPARAVVPRLAGRAEPLHAIYPTASAERALDCLHRGVRRITDFLAEVPVDWVDETELAGIPDALRSFTDVDTPEDLERE